MSPRYFIHSIHHYRAKNEKVKKAQQLVDDLARSLVTGITPSQCVITYLKAKCAELDKMHPRTRPLIVSHLPNSGNVTIYCGDPGRAQIESGHIAISFSLTPVKQVIMFSREGELLTKEEGGAEV